MARDATSSEDTDPVVRHRWDRWAVPCLAALVATAYAALSLTRFRRFDTPSWDNAIFEQAVAAYARLEAPIVTIKGPGYNILGDHFSPVLAVLGPVYRVLPYAQTLLVAQAVLIGISVIPVGSYAIRRLGTGGGLAVTTAYGLGFGFQAAVWTDFHAVAFAVPLLAFAGVAYLERRWTAVLCWSLPLLLVKEDLGLTVLMIGLVTMYAGGRRAGAALAVSGLAGFLLVLFVLIPALNPDGGYDYVTAVGGGGSAGPGPWTTLWTGVDTKALTLALTFGITGFLALGSPWALVTLPTLAWRFVGDNPYYWGTDWHYSLVLMPIVFVAMLDTLVRLREGRAGPLRTYASHVPTLVAGVAIVLCLQYPLARLGEAQTYEESPRADAAQTVMGMVPEGASVETDVGLMTHLAADREVYWTGTVGSVVPDYVLVDTEAGWSRVPDVVAYAEQQHPGVTYEQVFDRDGYLLARRAP